MFSRGTAVYGGDLDLSRHNSPHVQLIKMVGANKKVLEVGPGIGHVTKHLKKAHCQVTCVELDACSAAKVREHTNDVVVGDIESEEVQKHIAGKRFEVVTFGDVLEHLGDPLRVLLQMRAVLSPDGYIVASIPNIAHRSMRLSLLFGEFNYADAGLLDRTHLRFFTKTSIEQLMAEAGYQIVEVFRVRDASLMDGYLRKTASPGKRILLEIVKMLFRVFVRGEGLTYQFVIKAVPMKVCMTGSA